MCKQAKGSRSRLGKGWRRGARSVTSPHFFTTRTRKLQQPRPIFRWLGQVQGGPSWVSRLEAVRVGLAPGPIDADWPRPARFGSSQLAAGSVHLMKGKRTGKRMRFRRRRRRRQFCATRVAKRFPQGFARGRQHPRSCSVAVPCSCAGRVAGWLLRWQWPAVYRIGRPVGLALRGRLGRLVGGVAGSWMIGWVGR